MEQPYNPDTSGKRTKNRSGCGSGDDGGSSITVQTTYTLKDKSFRTVIF